jgi:hypothetical protein
MPGGGGPESAHRRLRIFMVNGADAAARTHALVTKELVLVYIRRKLNCETPLLSLS